MFSVFPDENPAGVLGSRWLLRGNSIGNNAQVNLAETGVVQHWGNEQRLGG